MPAPSASACQLPESRIALDDLHKRMQQSEDNASSIERQLNDVRAHLRSLREQVALDESKVESIDVESLLMPASTLKMSQQQQQLHEDHQDQQDEVRSVLEVVDAHFSKLKRKVDEVQIDLHMSWMSLNNLHLQLNGKQHVDPASAVVVAQQLESKNQVLEQLSGSYERLRHAFIDKEEELRYESHLATNTLSALAVTHRDTDLKLLSIQQEMGRLKQLAHQLSEWCSTTEALADDQCVQLRGLRTELLSMSACLLQITELQVVDAIPHHEWWEVHHDGESLAVADAPSLPLSPSNNMFQEMSDRLEVLVQELKAGGIANDKFQGSDKANAQPPKEGGKRKLSEAFQEQPQRGGIEEREAAFLSQKAAFLGGLRESFEQVRQREVACTSQDRRLLKARLLLEQAQRGCVSSDVVSMKSKRQVEQAYKELLQVQRDMDKIKARSLELVAGAPPALPPGDMAMELGRQTEANIKLKQQVAKLCLQAERAEGMVAVERLEIEKLRRQVQGVSERLKHEARCLNESHAAALRARDATIQELRGQLEGDETSKLLSATVARNEELCAEREVLLAKLSGLDLDLLKLRNENVCLVVEKIAFEGSARALQEKMASLMTKLSHTHKHWKRFVVYCQRF